jgi:hypothetical protein
MCTLCFRPSTSPSSGRTMKLRKCYAIESGCKSSLIRRYSSVPLVELETERQKTHMFYRYSDSSSRERPHISNLLLLSMFATAARYDQAELPPLDPGNLWEAGLDYMVQAREVLSMIPCLTSLQRYLHCPRPCLSLLQRDNVSSPVTSRATRIRHRCATFYMYPQLRGSRNSDL